MSRALASLLLLFFAGFLAAEGDMATVVHYTDEAGMQAISQK